jgi:hypothetical protein
MSERPTNFDRELLAAAAAGDLTDAERAVVDAMCAGDPEARAELEALELAAGAVVAAESQMEEMPAALRAQILQTRRLQIQPEQRREGSASRPMAYLGWLAAAACLALAAVAWFAGGPGATPEQAPTLAEQRQQLLAEAPDAIQLDWQDWAAEGAPPEIAGVQGDVVWSESRQEGYLRFVGLPRNDANEQYQLWIIDRRGLFDETGQSARISGAIFDAREGELIVPIDPAIPVKEAGAFAVTIEEPGGVWASDMTRRVVIAARG